MTMPASQVCESSGFRVGVPALIVLNWFKLLLKVAGLTPALTRSATHRAEPWPTSPTEQGSVPESALWNAPPNTSLIDGARRPVDRVTRNNTSSVGAYSALAFQVTALPKVL